jgi:hypothetical protein
LLRIKHGVHVNAVLLKLKHQACDGHVALNYLSAQSASGTFEMQAPGVDSRDIRLLSQFIFLCAETSGMSCGTRPEPAQLCLQQSNYIRRFEVRGYRVCRKQSFWRQPCSVSLFVHDGPFLPRIIDGLANVLWCSESLTQGCCSNR